MSEKRTTADLTTGFHEQYKLFAISLKNNDTGTKIDFFCNLTILDNIIKDLNVLREKFKDVAPYENME